MPELLKDMPEELNLKGIGFASYKERFFKLVQLIAENPDAKLLIVEAYRVLLPEGSTRLDARLDSLAAKYQPTTNPTAGP
jgi:hypothetical protein